MCRTVFNCIIMRITVIISHYRYNGYLLMHIVCICCATVWLGVGGVNYVRGVHVCMLHAPWISRPEGRHSGGQICHLQKQAIKLVWRPARLMFHCCSRTQAHTLSRTPARQDRIYEELLKEMVRRLHDHFLAPSKVSWCPHVQHQARREAMQDFQRDLLKIHPLCRGHCNVFKA